MLSTVILPERVMRLPVKTVTGLNIDSVSNHRSTHRCAGLLPNSDTNVFFLSFMFYRHVFTVSSKRAPLISKFMACPLSLLFLRTDLIDLRRCS